MTLTEIELGLDVEIDQEAEDFAPEEIIAIRGRCADARSAGSAAQET